MIFGPSRLETPVGTVTLTDNDLSGLRDAIRTLVSPLAHADVDAWRRAVNRRLKPLLGADKATFQFPGEGAEDLISEEMDPDDLRPYLPLVRHFQRRLWGNSKVIFQRVVALGVCDRRSLYGDDLERYYETEYYNEYIRPHRAHDALMAAVALPGPRPPVQLYFHHDRPRGGSFEPRAQALLRLLHPALEAGVRTQMAFGIYRERLTATLDVVPDGALLLDLHGRLLHRNPVAARILESDPQEERIEACVRDLARGFGSMELRRGPASRPRTGEKPEKPVSRTVRTALDAYRLQASLLNGDDGYSSPLVLVIVASGRRRPPDPRALKERFGLTDRQTEVALLLARRLSNREIADALSISPHTARHHTEMVLRRLGISSRRKVRPRLLEGAGSGTASGTTEAPRTH